MNDKPITEEERQLSRVMTVMARSMLEFCRDDQGFTPGMSITSMALAIALTAAYSENSLTDERLAAVTKTIRDYYDELIMERARGTRMN